MNFEPLYDRVLIKPYDSVDKSMFGIIIPDTAKEKPILGTVVAIGKGKFTKEGVRLLPEVSKGDTVVFPKYSGAKTTIDNQDYQVLKMSEILAILE